MYVQTEKSELRLFLNEQPDMGPHCLSFHPHLLDLLLFHQTKLFHFNPTALRTAKTSWSFGCSECNRVKTIMAIIFVVPIFLSFTVGYA